MYPVEWEDSVGQSQSEPIFDRIIRFFMATNCLYFLSAFFLLLGAYLMINSDILSQNLDTRAYQVYSIIQGYEIILIVIFLLVVRKLGVPEDGLVLAGIEILLFLDPLFFNNVFYTVNIPTGLSFGFTSLFLLLVKFLIVFQVGRLPMIPRLNGALFLTAGFIYFYPIALDTGLVGEFDRMAFYLLSWMPLFVALALPEAGDVSDSAGSESPFTAEQRQNFFLGVSLILMYIVISHFFWTRGIFEQTVKSLHLSPLFLTACILMLKLKPDWLYSSWGRLFIWGASLGAVLFSFTKEAIDFSIGYGPVEFSCLSVVLLAAIYLHYYVWKRTQENSHVAAGLVLTTLFLSGAFPSSIASNLMSLYAPPFVFLTLVISGLAWYKKSPVLTFVAGVFLILSVFGGFKLFRYEYGLFMLVHVMVYWMIALLSMFKYDKDYLLRSMLLLGLISHTLLKSGGFEVHTLYSAYFWCLALGFFAWSCYFSIPTYFVISIGAMATRLSMLHKGKIITWVKFVPKGINSGVFMIILSFVVLAMGYMVSAKKSMMRRDSGPPNLPGGGLDPLTATATDLE
ncbi:MAG: hypothetical protein QGH40_10680 [bacterium]|jgi:hypothetical protein|nr:hypothetical protein [bacterium]